MTTTSLRPAVGRDALAYLDARHPDRPLVIHTYRPAAHGPDDPVVLVQHGIKRNGDEYRDFWIDAAEKHRVLVVATTFGDEAFPKPENYNNGMVVAPDGDGAPARGLALRDPAARRGGAARRRRHAPAAGAPLRAFGRRAVRAPPDGHAGPCDLRGRHARQSGVVHPADPGSAVSRRGWAGWASVAAISRAGSPTR